MRRPLVVLTLVLGGLVALWGAFVLLDLLSRSEERRTQSLDLRGGPLALETDSGDLEVVAAEGPPRLELRSVTGLFGGPGTRVERSPSGVLSVKTNCTGPFSLSCSGSLRVLVPPATRVQLDTGSGDVTVRGVQGGVVAETGSGDVRLTGVAGGRVDAETGSGNVEGTGLAATAMRLETGSGDLDLVAVRPPRDLEADTGSGDVELTVPDTTYDVGTETGSGDQRVTVDADDDAPRRLRISTGSGDVTVRPGR